MSTKKIWILYKSNADQTDATFIFGLGCKVEVKIPKPLRIETMNGKQFHYQAEHTTIEITTTCEKQESMLKLKYSNNLYLLKVEYENFDMASQHRSTT
jgi:hypothetical protein